MFTCPKCNGTGKVSFHHIQNGDCFLCGATGKLAYLQSQKIEADPHPEKLVAEGNRCTQKQWDLLSRLTKDNDREFCRIVHLAGGEATMRYLDKKTMSRAIEMAIAKA